MDNYKNLFLKYQFFYKFKIYFTFLTEGYKVCFCGRAINVCFRRYWGPNNCKIRKV